MPKSAHGVTLDIFRLFNQFGIRAASLKPVLGPDFVGAIRGMPHFSFRHFTVSFPVCFLIAVAVIGLEAAAMAGTDYFVAQKAPMRLT
jgi:hypothetical protein